MPNKELSFLSNPPNQNRLLVLVMLQATTMTAPSSESGILQLRLGYAMGHVLNDLCCAMYFSYLLVFLELAGLSPVQAGWVLIAGQLVDGLTTPIVGWLSDRFTCSSTCCYGFGGRRKSWYMAGMMLVSATF